MSAYTAKFRIGEIQFEITADSEREIFDRATVFGEIPRTCGKCDSTRLWPRHRVAQGRYHYYEVFCMDCGQRCKIGQTQESGAFFCRGEWEPPYVPDERDERGETRGGEEERGRRRDTAPVQPAQRQTEHRQTFGAGKSYGQR